MDCVDVLTSLTEAVCRGRSGVVAVTGEAGIGKSRLVDEVLDGMRRVEPRVAAMISGGMISGG